MANVPVSLLQGGSVLDVQASGSINIASGGSIQIASGGVFSNAGVNSVASGGLVNVASGGSINVASGGSIQVASGGQIYVAGATGLSAPSGITIGGTVGRWAFGTSALTAGLGTIATGLSRVLAANAVTVLGEPPSAGSALFVLVDLSLSAAGSVIYRAGSAAGQFGAGATVAWAAFGT